MSKQEKLKQRLLSKPKDFTFEELVSLLGIFGYQIYNNGKTSGSSVMFENKRNLNIPVIRMHKPHPSNVLKQYQIIEVINSLKEARFI